MEKIDRRASVVPLAFNPESLWYIPIKFVNEVLTDFDLSSYDLELNVTDNDSQLTSLMPNGQVFEIVDCSRKFTTYDDNNNKVFIENGIMLTDDTGSLFEIFYDVPRSQAIPNKKYNANLVVTLPNGKQDVLVGFQIEVLNKSWGESNAGETTQNGYTVLPIKNLATTVIQLPLKSLPQINLS